jgi:hypothetical protein
VRIVAGHLCLDGKKRLHILPRAARGACHSGTWGCWGVGVR